MNLYSLDVNYYYMIANREIASTHARIVPGKHRYVIGGIVR